MQTNTHPSWGKRLLAMALVLAMLLAYLPGNVVPHAHAVTLAPQPGEIEENRVVYVSATGTDYTAEDFNNPEIDKSTWGKKRQSLQNLGIRNGVPERDG